MHLRAAALDRLPRSPFIVHMPLEQQPEKRTEARLRRVVSRERLLLERPREETLRQILRVLTRPPPRHARELVQRLPVARHERIERARALRRVRAIGCVLPSRLKLHYVLLGRGGAHARFDTLVACYWKPLYKYARVAWQRSREDAEDLTQSFFTRAFEKESLAAYDARRRASARFSGCCSTGMSRMNGRRGRRSSAAARRCISTSMRPRRRSGGNCASVDAGGVLPARVGAQRLRAGGRAAARALRGEGKQVQFAIFERYDLDDDRGVSYASSRRASASPRRR